MISTRHRPATRSALPNPKTISGSRKPGCREPPTDGNRELRSPATGAPGHRQPIPARPASVSREVSPSVDENRTAQLRRKGLPVRDVAHSRRVPAGGQDGALAVPSGQRMRDPGSLPQQRVSGAGVRAATGAKCLRFNRVTPETYRRDLSPFRSPPGGRRRFRVRAARSAIPRRLALPWPAGSHACGLVECSGAPMLGTTSDDVSWPISAALFNCRCSRPR